MLDRMVEKVRQQEIFSREDTPTERRVLAGFMYHAGLSFRRIEPFVDVCHVAVHDWYHRLKELFEPDRARRPIVAVDETTLNKGDYTIRVRAETIADDGEAGDRGITAGKGKAMFE